MISRILVVLGPCCLALGLWQGGTGLIIVGGLWIVMAAAMRGYASRAQDEADRRRTDSSAAAFDSDEAAENRRKEAPISGATFLLGTALLLIAGVPALIIGWTRWGTGDDPWQWIPLIGGAAATLLAVGSTLLYALGAGITAVSGPVPTIDAEIVIVTMEQTNVYVNERPRIEFVFDVRAEGRAPYRVTKRATVPFTALGGLEVGKGFRARVAGPRHPTTMDIDWAAPIDQTSADGIADRLQTLDDLLRQGTITREEHDEQRARILNQM